MTDHNILCTSHDIKYSYAEGGVAPARAKVNVKGQCQKHDIICSSHDPKYMHTTYEHCNAYSLRVINSASRWTQLNSRVDARVDVVARTNGRTDTWTPISRHAQAGATKIKTTNAMFSRLGKSLCDKTTHRTDSKNKFVQHYEVVLRISKRQRNSMVSFRMCSVKMNTPRSRFWIGLHLS